MGGQWSHDSPWSRETLGMWSALRSRKRDINNYTQRLNTLWWNRLQYCGRLTFKSLWYVWVQFQNSRIYNSLHTQCMHNSHDGHIMCPSWEVYIIYFSWPISCMYMLVLHASCNPRQIYALLNGVLRLWITFRHIFDIWFYLYMYMHKRSLLMITSSGIEAFFIFKIGSFKVRLWPVSIF